MSPHIEVKLIYPSLQVPPRIPALRIKQVPKCKRRTSWCQTAEGQCEYPLARNCFQHPVVLLQIHLSLVTDVSTQIHLGWTNDHTHPPLHLPLILHALKMLTSRSRQPLAQDVFSRIFRPASKGRTTHKAFGSSYISKGPLMVTFSKVITRSLQNHYSHNEVTTRSQQGHYKVTTASYSAKKRLKASKNSIHAETCGRVCFAKNVETVWSFQQ